MFVKSLSLQNFRNFSDKLITFTQPRALLVGHNGTGKSTVFDAIALLVVGRCRGTDAAGKGAKRLITTGADRAVITASMAGIGDQTIIREIAAEGSTATSHKPDAIQAKLGVSDALLEALIYTKSFFSMAHADGKSLLMGLLGVGVKAADLKGCGIEKGKKTVSLGELDSLYDVAVKQRPILKRSLAAVVVPELPPAVEIADLDVLTAQIEQQDAEMEAAVAEHARSGADLASMETQLTRLRGRVVDVSKIEAQIEVHEGLKAKAQRELEAKAAALSTHREGQQVDVKAASESLGGRKSLIIRLQQHAPESGCVLNSKIPCHTGAEHFQQEIAGLEAEVAALQTQIAKSEQWKTEDTTLAEQVSAAHTDVTFHENELNGLRKTLTQQQDDAAEIARLEAAVVPLPAKVAALAQQIDTLRVGQGDTRDKVGAAHAYKAAKAAHAEATARRQKVEADLAECEARVLLMGPNGARVKALGAAVGDFEAKINAALGIFGFYMRFQVDPWDVLVGEISEHGSKAPAVGFDLLSDGEQRWVGVAFQLALAKVSGVGFCCVDATETVVGTQRRRLTDMVMKSDVEQVIVAIAKSEHEARPTSVDGLQVIEFA